MDKALIVKEKWLNRTEAVGNSGQRNVDKRQSRTHTVRLRAYNGKYRNSWKLPSS